MNAGLSMLAVSAPLPQWFNFLAMAAGMLLGILGVLIWFLFFRKKQKRKRRQHHHEKRLANPTLANTGGLPPKRDPDQPTSEL
jgi:Trk-type K+ transport system membrane component